MFKRTLTISDGLLAAVNLVPVWGVWMAGWNAGEVFMVYFLESIVIGLYNLVKLGITSMVKRRDIWNNTGAKVTWMPGLFFMFFFLIHYSFFIIIQLSIFLAVSGTQAAYGISNAFDFVFHFPRYLSDYSQWLLLGFVVSYGLITLKDFILNGAFKTASLNAIMFAPYGRIFIQQFTVIAGSLFLGFGAGKIFITVFAGVKIFFEVWVNYERIIAIMVKKEESAIRSQQ